MWTLNGVGARARPKKNMMPKLDAIKRWLHIKGLFQNIKK
jgi:hypothetical protein